MSLTKPVNSKSNIKQFTDADLPFSPRQPVIARYAAESTLNQTVISLPFQVDTVNAADSFILTVDGKVLTPGATNDYQFSGIDSFGFSNSVTLNYPIAAALNIQGIKLGLKKETDFLQDARITQIYEGMDQGFQGFIRTSDLMVATTSVGAPGSGQFYSQIQNRAAMPDLRTDLKARMGIERMAVQQIYAIQNELGPNGEAVWGATNDILGQIRLVGNWSSVTTNNGSRPQTSSGLTTDFIEVTFYGTGLNLCVISNVSSRTHVYSVDGGAESSNFYPSLSNIIAGRNYNSNTVIPVVSGLALGVHTVKIRNTNAAQNMDFSGIEILNESSSIRVNPGVSYLAGKKAASIVQSTISYNSAFESGTLGTRGGRVIVYQKSDGTIAKAVQPVDASQLNLASANHANEEVSRIHNFREFGAGRTDDFSRIIGLGAANYAFVLDDGTTSLVMATGASGGVGFNTPKEAIQAAPTATTNYITFSFVGTGLDIIAVGDGSSRNYDVLVNGTNVGNLVMNAGVASRTLKVVSGLPYGSHSVRFVNTGSSFGIADFIVYQPKKPTVPADAVELADYNVMADYSGATITGTAVTDHLQRPLGTLQKFGTREVAYVGTWTSSGISPNNPTGEFVFSNTLNDYYEYVFFGTGLVVNHQGTVSGTYTFEVQIDGAVNATGVARSNVTNAGSGNYTTTSATGDAPIRVEFTGLALGYHKVRVTLKTASRNMGLGALYIISPIHSAKSDLYSDLQNSLSIGSCAISDNRKTSAIKDVGLQPKSWAQAGGISSGPTSTATSATPVPDLSLTVKTSGGALEIASFITLRNNTLSSSNTLSIYVDGVLAAPESTIDVPVANNNNAHNITAIVPVSPGTHKVDIYHRTSGGTTTFAGTGRLLKVREI